MRVGRATHSMTSPAGSSQTSSLPAAATIARCAGSQRVAVTARPSLRRQR
ncbi:MAG: hypothetical protein ACTHMR_21325 [Thermomicrobiales bacterium]